MHFKGLESVATNVRCASITRAFDCLSTRTGNSCISSRYFANPSIRVVPEGSTLSLATKPNLAKKDLPPRSLPGWLPSTSDTPRSAAPPPPRSSSSPMCPICDQSILELRVRSRRTGSPIAQLALDLLQRALHDRTACSITHCRSDNECRSPHRGIHPKLRPSPLLAWPQIDHPLMNRSGHLGP